MKAVYFSSLTLFIAAASGRVAGVHEAPALKVDEGDLFPSLTLFMAAASGRVAARHQATAATLAAHAPHGGREAAARRQKAAAHEASAFKVDEGHMLADEVEVRMKRPCAKSTKANYFSPLTLLMARPCAKSTNANYFSPLTLLMAAAGGRVAAESCRMKERDPLDPPLAIIVQSRAE